MTWSDATGDFVGCYEYEDCVAWGPVAAPTPPPTQPTSAAISRASFRPPVCIPEGQRCYRTTDQETVNRFNDCCRESSGAVSMTSEGGPWSAVCTRYSGTIASTKLPTFEPKGNEWGLIEIPAVTARDSCVHVANLGPASSRSSGYLATFPLPGRSDFYSPPGRESQVGFLVGGSYTSIRGHEIEGNIVVLGDFTIGASGLALLGAYQLDGSVVYPDSDTSCSHFRSFFLFVGQAGRGSGIYLQKGVSMRVGGEY